MSLQSTAEDEADTTSRRFTEVPGLAGTARGARADHAARMVARNGGARRASARSSI